MDEAQLAAGLSNLLDPTLATELARDFLSLRNDAATATLGRASPGKFVETFVQCHQWMATGKFDEKPSVDSYLTKTAEAQVALPEGLRIVAPRMARTIYTLRNKRNIAHKNPVDANTHDLATAHQAAVWIMSELLREATGITMEQAGKLIAQLQAPVGTLVEEIEGVRLVHAKTGIKNEILVLLHSHYPDKMSVQDLMQSMRNAKAPSLKSRLSELLREKKVFGDASTGYLLTKGGFEDAVRVVAKLQTQ